MKNALKERGENPLADLAGRIARIEGRSLAPEMQGPALTLGIAAVDALLNGGRGSAVPAPILVPARTLHEVRAAAMPDAAPAFVFALALALRVAAQGDGFFVSTAASRAEGGEPYGPGLAALGLLPQRLFRVHARTTAEALWAAGEIAGHKGAGFCLLELSGNPPAAGLSFTRRVALRSREAGVAIILLRQGGDEEASAALTRWRVAAAPSNPGEAARKWLGPPAFAVTLEKCRGTAGGNWTMEWNGYERRFELSTAARNGAPGFGAPLSVGQPAEAGDRSHPAPASWPGLATRRSA